MPTLNENVQTFKRRLALRSGFKRFVNLCPVDRIVLVKTNRTGEHVMKAYAHLYTKTYTLIKIQSFWQYIVAILQQYYGNTGSIAAILDFECKLVSHNFAGMILSGKMALLPKEKY